MAAWQGSAFVAPKGCETMGVLRKRAHSSGKVPLVPQQSALQPRQKRGSPASSGPETFTTIDVKAQFSVQKKAGPGPVAWLGRGTMLSLRTAFVTWELKPFALFQRTVPLSSLPIALWAGFEGHYMTFVL